MAKLYPTYDEILKLKVKPTDGELHLIDFLRESLTDDYEVFFQPFLNGDYPDIIIMRKGGGVLIIEVKDWNLNHYSLDKKGKWYYNKSRIKSPVSQVLRYKENLYDLHIDNLLQLKLKDYKYLGFVKCALFFYKETEKGVKDFLLDVELEGDNERYINYKTFINKNILALGKDSLEYKKFITLLYDNGIGRNSRYFSSELYNSFKRYLAPPFHSYKDGADVYYTNKQKVLSESKKGEYKIRGVVGSGKTMILAKRAVNAYKRTNENVLILTYNISLRNYIHDKISDVREDFEWKYFNIVNYHEFFNATLNNLGIPLNVPDAFSSQKQKDDFFEDNYYSNIELFEENKDKIFRYQTILIDEVQDYRTPWLIILKRYFLEDDGEFVVFGDSKQDIYNRVQLKEGRKELIIPDSPGRWSELNQSFRLTPTITSFATLFQQEFLAETHNIEKFENIPFQATFFDKVHYKYFKELNHNQIAEFIFEYSKEIKVHPNDICVLSLSVDVIRKLDEIYRSISKENTYIMSETEEEYHTHRNDERKNVEKLRKNKKLHFWMNSGMTKFSTVHSFKGWEINTLFFIIQKDSFEEAYNELIYTGFTRCLNNLILLNIDDDELDTWINRLDFIEK